MVNEERLLNALNEQGFLFQEKCFEVLKQREQSTNWKVVGYNHPVYLPSGEETKVDIILQYMGAKHATLYAVIECKRANPEYVEWLFGIPGSGFDSAIAYLTKIDFDHLHDEYDPDQYYAEVAKANLGVITHIAQNWAEVKAQGKKQSGRSSTSQNIENAFVQVLQGVAGLAHEQGFQRAKTGGPRPALFVPVVVTTANVNTAYYQIRDVDLETGHIDPKKVNLECEWVMAQYDAGQRLVPDPIPANNDGVDPVSLAEFKQRSIFIVNAKELILFFTRMHPDV